MSSITLTIYSNRAEYQIRFPASWHICPACEGSAVTTRHVECDGGGITSMEMDELEYDNPGFKRRYMRGDYDRPCPDCNGLGRVQMIDRDQVTGWREKIMLRAFDKQERDSREIDRISAMERRMGA